MKEVFQVINQMLVDGVIVNYAIGGAIAASFYAEAAATEDIDIFVLIKPDTPPFSELTEIYAYLAERGYYPKEEFVDVEGWDVQFLSFPEGSIEDIAVQEANIIKFYDQEIRVIMAEYLVAIMLDVGGDKYNSRAKSFIQQDAVKIPELEILIERFHLEESWQKLKQKLKRVIP